jgi:hypothetical protein
MRSERTFSLAMAVILHSFAIAWLLIARPVSTLRHESLSEFSMEAVSIPAEREPAHHLSPPPMPTPRPRPRPGPVSMTVGDSDTKSVDQAVGGNCLPVDAIAKSIMGDAEALVALRTVPKSERSISEVIVIWNAGWSAATTGDDALLAPVRNNIAQVLGSLPPNCLAESVAGPRLVQIPTDRGTTFLAFGSGNWNWSQLIDDTPQSSIIGLPSLQ